MITRLLRPIIISTLLVWLNPIPASWAATTPANTIAPMLTQVTPAIVNITVVAAATSDDPFELNDNPSTKKNTDKNRIGLGSGIIIDEKKGYIVTNAHVINHSKHILVTLKDGRRYRAKPIGEDDGFDIAIIQIQAKHLTRLAFGDSDQLKVGDFVAAIGSPFGLNQTVTYGVISALNRSEPKIEGFQSFIQTDAPINPGNSGGALVNLKGECIGINTALVGPGSSAGIGFSIPSNMVKSITSQLIQYGKVKRGILGVIAQNITPSLADAMHLKQTTGAIVSQVVADSPAAKAGIQIRDVLLTIDKKPMNSAEQVRNTLGMLRPGTVIHIEILRNNKKKTLSATVGDPNTLMKKIANPFLEGMNLRDFNERQADGHMLTGVLITRISEDSQAALTGLLPGDVITRANGTLTPTIKALEKVAHTSTSSLLMNIDRNNLHIFLVIERI